MIRRSQLSSRRLSSGEEAPRQKKPEDHPPKPDSQFAIKQRSFFSLLREYSKLLHGQLLVITQALAFATLAAVLKLAAPAAIGLATDSVLGGELAPSWFLRIRIPESPKTVLSLAVLVIVVTAVLAVLANLRGQYLNHLVFLRVQSRLRKGLFAHAIRLPLHRLQERKSGGTVSLLRDDAGNAAGLIGNLLYTPWRSFIQLGGTVLILAAVDWRMIAIPILLVPLIYLTHRKWINRQRPLWRAIHASREKMDGHATEVFNGIRILRTFGRQRTETGRYIRNQHLMVRQKFRAWWAAQQISLFWGITLPCAAAILLWYGGTRVLDDSMLVEAGKLAAREAFTTGDLVMFLVYLAMLLEPFAALANSASGLQNGLAGLERVLALLDEKAEKSSAGIILDQSAPAGRIDVRQVSFRYPDTAIDVLKSIDISITAGSTVALVGPSGAGKTTLCNLILRFYDISEGSIALDGTDIREIELDSYRRQFGVVEQEVFLFDGSIADNIAYGAPHATEEDITKAATDSHAAEFIDRLPDSYDTPVGEHGVWLSGGQRQRIAIARALLADPRILVLDEATSDLDPESESLVRASLDQLMRDRTSIVIAHQLSTVKNADLILVMEDGRIIERGTHDELSGRSSRYHELLQAHHKLKPHQ